MDEFRSIETRLTSRMSVQRDILSELNADFQRAKAEQIFRFLQDQEELNKKFAEYELNDDDDADAHDDTESQYHQTLALHRMRVPQNSGPGSIVLRDIEDDALSVLSNRSNLSDEEFERDLKHEQHVPHTDTYATQTLEKRKLVKKLVRPKSAVGLSKSLSIPNNSLTELSHSMSATATRDIRRLSVTPTEPRSRSRCDNTKYPQPPSLSRQSSCMSGRPPTPVNPLGLSTPRDKIEMSVFSPPQNLTARRKELSVLSVSKTPLSLSKSHPSPTMGLPDSSVGIRKIRAPKGVRPANLPETRVALVRLPPLDRARTPTRPLSGRGQIVRAREKTPVPTEAIELLGN